MRHGKARVKNALWTVLFLPLISPAWSAQNKKPQDCTPKQLASTEVVLGEQILVPVDFNQRTVWMVLGLSDTFSLLSPSAVETLHIRLEKQPNPYMKIDGKYPVTATGTVDSLSIGKYRLARRDFFVNPNPRPTDASPERIVLGSLGMGDLWPVDFELDLAHRHFNLYSSDHCPKPVATLWEHYSAIPMELSSLGNVYFPLEVDGIKIEAGISTMHPQTNMGLDVARQIFGFDERSPDVKARDDASGHAVTHFRAMTLTLGDLRWSNVAVRLADPPAAECRLSKTGAFGAVPGYQGRDGALCFGAYPLVLGRQEIERMRLYFSTKEKTIYFTAAD